MSEEVAPGCGPGSSKAGAQRAGQRRAPRRTGPFPPCDHPSRARDCRPSARPPPVGAPGVRPRGRRAQGLPTAPTIPARTRDASWGGQRGRDWVRCASAEPRRRRDPLAQRQSSGLLIRWFRVRIPGGSPAHFGLCKPNNEDAAMVGGTLAVRLTTTVTTTREKTLRAGREDAVHERCRVASQRRHDVGVRVHRQRDLRVSQDLHDDAGMDPLGEQQRRAAVA